VPPPRTRHADVDGVNRAILDQLAVDGRRSVARIGKAVGLDRDDVRSRLQRMTADGLLRVTAVVDPAYLDATCQATVGICSRGDLNLLAERAAAIALVERVTVTCGVFDVVATLRCRDEAQLLETINQHLRTIPGVVSTETLITLRRVK
jgi:Lrp/AsnC family transcriptional regulator, regulator for asnA, asnC and gidA